MGKSSKAPKPSEEERTLQAAQTATLQAQNAALKKQYAQEELLAPILYKQAGLKPIYDTAPGAPGKSAVQQYIENTGNQDFKNMASEYMERHSGGTPTIEGLKSFASSLNINQRDNFVSDIGGFQASGGGDEGPGRIIGFEEIKDEAATLRESIELQQLKRSEAALRGDLPVDPALERSLMDEEKTLRDIMANRLGPGWETSTPGIEALANFKQRAEELRFGARRDAMTTAEALSIQREGANQQRLFGGIGAARQGPTSIAQLFGENAAGFGSAVAGYRGERLQLAANKSQQKSALIGGVGSLVGTAAGVALAMGMPGKGATT